MPRLPTEVYKHQANEAFNMVNDRESIAFVKILTSVEVSQPMHSAFRSRSHFHRTCEQTIEATLSSLPDRVLAIREILESIAIAVFHHSKLRVFKVTECGYRRMSNSPPSNIDRIRMNSLNCSERTKYCTLTCSYIVVHANTVDGSTPFDLSTQANGTSKHVHYILQCCRFCMCICVERSESVGE
jgi:hypothetical protein